MLFVWFGLFQACVHGEYDVYEQELNDRWRALWLWANPSTTEHDTTPISSSGSGSGSDPQEEVDDLPLLTNGDNGKQQA